jgi:hypothetical protein
MKKILLFFLFLLSYFSFSQSNKDLTINKIKTFISKNGVLPGTDKLAGNTPVIYFDKSTKEINIDNSSFSLSEVNIIYEYKYQYGNHSVTFECKYSKCISDINGYKSDGFGIPISSKSKCYELIGLFNQLKY